VDQEIKNDLARLEREIEAHIAAVEKRQEWIDKESRHQASIRSLIQLLISRAIDVNEVLPARAAQQAMRFGIPFPPHIGPVNAASAPVADPAPNLKSVESRAEELPTDNKTEFVRKLILHRSAVGHTPAEIKKIAASLRMEMTANFPYTILSKLKARGEIKELDGKYYPPDEW
jgi:hypothetical protein